MPTVKETKSQPKGWQFAKSLQFQLLSRTRSRIIEDLKLWQLPPVQSRTYSLDDQDEEQCCSILQQNGAFESNSRLRLLILLLPVTTILVLTRSYHPGHEITAVFPGGALRFTHPSGLQTVVPIVSGGLLVWVALHLVEFDAVQLLKPLVTELTSVVVMRLRSVFLHVPVQWSALSTLVAANFTPKTGGEKKQNKKRMALGSLGGCIDALGLGTQLTGEVFPPCASACGLPGDSYV